MSPERLVLYTDGGSRTRDKRYAAAAAVLTDGKRVLKKEGWFLGDVTNNIAEYIGLIRGMELARSYSPEELICISDSQLMIRQLNGDYRVKNEGLRRLFSRVMELEKDFGLVLYVHSHREHPMIQRADSLLNTILDRKCGSR